MTEQDAGTSQKNKFKICKQRLTRILLVVAPGFKVLNKFKTVIFPVELFGGTGRIHYFCNVFFMVLDLRLTMKIGCRETTISFLYNSYQK
jgi:hypothetical protein